VVDSSGNVWVADSGHGFVKEFTNQGGFIRSFGKGNPDNADAVALDSAGNVYVANLAGGGIEKYSSTGTLLQTIVSPQLYEPSGVAVDSSGNIWVASLANHQIVEFASNGEFERLISELTPYGISVDKSGNVWVADPNIAPYNINEFSATGAYIESVGADAGLQGCTGVTVDSSGNVWVANMAESQIVELTPVPEPSPLFLLCIGAVSLLTCSWRRRRCTI
jgi:streptogramin lyase